MCTVSLLALSLFCCAKVSGFRPCTMCTVSPLALSHNRSVPFLSPERATRPFALSAQAVTLPVCPCTMCTVSPLVVSHRRSVPSAEAERASCPSALSAQSVTSPVWPSRMCSKAGSGGVSDCEHRRSQGVVRSGRSCSRASWPTRPVIWFCSSAGLFASVIAPARIALASLAISASSCARSKSSSVATTLSSVSFPSRKRTSVRVVSNASRAADPAFA